MRTRAAATLAALLLPVLARAQEDEPPEEEAPPPTLEAEDLGLPGRLDQPQARDSFPSDTTRQPRRELVKWAEPDSVMQALLEREGYTPTRYQGTRAALDARTNEIRLSGDAAVRRGETVLVGDTIVYNDSTDIVRAAGDTVILRDPAQGEEDLVALGRMVYDIGRQSGTVTSVSTAVRSGEKWYVAGEQAGFRIDSIPAGRRVFYAHDGAITSCELTEPHYHFRSSTIKVIANRVMVARPAVLYIADIPVMWLPFVFQDMRTGRRSGILSPRFGVSDIVRNSSGYRRQIENVGYYFAISDYMDAQFSLDWRSGARSTPEDPGWTRYNGEWRYRWLDRFLSGRIAVTRTNQDNGSNNTALSWAHQQDFSQRSHLTANLNYVSSTQIQRQQSFNVAQALATISSQLNFQQELGAASFSIGGSRKQYPGRDQVDQDLPTLSISTKPINLGDWLVWTPSLAASNSQSFDIDGTGQGLPFRYFPGAGGGIDSARFERNERQTTLNFDTPLQIFGFNWRNSFAVRDVEHDYPESRIILGVRDTTQRTVRVYDRTFVTNVDWQTGIELPRIFQGRWNIVPSIEIANVDGSAGFWVRSERTGGDFVAQSKRLLYRLSASPTLFGFFPGFGPFSRIRHSISPSISYSYAPQADVSDEFLAALGNTRVGYLGALTQNQITLGLNQTFEAKIRTQNDTNPEAGEKIKLLALTFSPISYDFERARVTGRTGITTQNFTYTVRSDLLPGFDLSVGYSLFQGNVLSDSARFKPFRETISASLSIGKGRNPFTMLTRLFGRAVPPTSATDFSARDTSTSERQPELESPLVAGGVESRLPLGVPTTDGWEATFNFSSSRQRPPVGGNVVEFDPEERCSAFTDPIVFERCVDQQLALAQSDTSASTTAGGQFVRLPATSTLRANFTFNLTPRWAVQWGTGYDFEQSEFADHIVTLQRELHDWRAVFAFTQAPNGNFAFNFFVSLKAQPDLKFDYNRRTYRPED